MSGISTHARLARRLATPLLLPLAALLAISCNSAAPKPTPVAIKPAVQPIPPVAAPPDTPPPAVQPTPSTPPTPTPPLDPVVVLPAQHGVVTVQAEAAKYALPESMKLWRGGRQPPAAKGDKRANSSPPGEEGDTNKIVVTRPNTQVVTVAADEPRYALPESLKNWGGTRTAPLYADPNVEAWAAAPTERRLKNAAVSCNYKDEGGVRGRVVLLVDAFKVTRFNARIEMPNGGICQFDAKKMQQRPFEQGLALEAKGDECIVRMWEQKNRITVAAYNCHRQCSKGSFSYLWPILMDTRLGTCY